MKHKPYDQQSLKERQISSKAQKGKEDEELSEDYDYFRKKRTVEGANRQRTSDIRRLCSHINVTTVYVTLTAVDRDRKEKRRGERKKQQDTCRVSQDTL